MIGDIINCILNDLSCRSRKRDDMFEKSVKDRLDKSIKSYIGSLSGSAEYLVSQNEKTVMKLSKTGGTHKDEQ